MFEAQFDFDTGGFEFLNCWTKEPKRCWMPQRLSNFVTLQKRLRMYALLATLSPIIFLFSGNREHRETSSRTTLGWRTWGSSSTSISRREETLAAPIYPRSTSTLDARTKSKMKLPKECGGFHLTNTTMSLARLRLILETLGNTSYLKLKATSQSTTTSFVTLTGVSATTDFCGLAFWGADVDRS
jgi:hypothetical protein